MRALISASALALAACATTAPPHPVNPALTGPPLAAPALEAGADGDVLALALSGGGARAAAFSLGVLLELRDARRADDVALVTAVSGGSIIAAYFGQHGPDGLDNFRAAYLDKDWAAQLHTSLVSPLNWRRALSGGINDEDHLADWLDREVFAGETMGALWDGDGAQIWINAIDLYNGAVFAFEPHTFAALCSDLSAVRVADAVAASMAVPVAFKPILVEPRGDDCAPLPSWAAREDLGATHLAQTAARALRSYRDSAQLRYVHLVDGGVIDNLGLSSLNLMRQTAQAPYAPFSPESAVRLRRLTFLVVNAENIRDVDWQMRAEGPSGAQLLDTAYDVTVEAANRASYDSFAAMAAHWQAELIAWRCALSEEEGARLRGNDKAWACADLRIIVDMVSFRDLDEGGQHRLGAIPTRVSLPAEDIDALIEGGRAALRAAMAADR